MIRSELGAYRTEAHRAVSRGRSGSRRIVRQRVCELDNMSAHLAAIDRIKSSHECQRFAFCRHIFLAFEVGTFRGHVAWAERCGFAGHLLEEIAGRTV